MKGIHIFAILVALLFIVGCAKPAVQQETVQPTVAAEPEVQPVEQPTLPETAIVEAKKDLSFENVDETVARLIKTCEAGNVGVCTALKNKYNIEASPKSASTEEVVEGTTE